jgi:hypothetical protein
MTREHRQEALSRAYVHAVAAQAGVLWSRPTKKGMPPKSFMTRGLTLESFN